MCWTQLSNSVWVPLLLSIAGCSSPETCEDDDCAESQAVRGCVGFLEPGPDETCVARAWPPEQRHRLAEPGADDLEVSVDGLGRALVSWRRRHPDPAQSLSRLAEQTADGWAVHSLGSPARGFGSRATLATLGLEAWVSWTQHRTDESGADESTVHLLRRDDTGQWLSSDIGEQVSALPKAYEPRPVLVPTGEGFLVWNQWLSKGGYGVAVARRGPGGPLNLPHAPDDVISPQVFFSNAPQLAAATNGDALVTWYQATPPPGSTSNDPVSDGLRLFVSERTGAAGHFSKPAIDDWLSPLGPPLASHEIRNPVVAIGEFGQALVFWSQQHPSGAVGLYAASRTGKRRWTTPHDIDDTFGPLREFATCIDVAISPTREAHVTWFDGPPGATQVYAAHHDNAGQWDVPRTQALSTAGRTAQDPRLAVGPDGEVALVWSERGEDGRWRVMGRRRGPNAVHWSAAVELSVPEEGDAIGPVVAIGPDGTLAAAWTVGPLGFQTVSVSTLP
ncbi:MAG: hypothetical protein ACRBN8_28385 [Nannocystales bacterium]